MSADVPWLTDPEADAWLDLLAVAELVPAALDSQLERDAGMSFFEYSTLVQLADAPDRTLRVSDLAAHTNASIPRLSRVVSRLEAEGLVERTPDPTDGRGRRVHLTDLGLDRLADAAPGHVGTVNRLFVDVLDADEAAALSATCRRLLQALDPGRVVHGPTLRSRRGRPGLSSSPRP